MKIVNTPSQELTFTNYAYCSVVDFQKFAIPGSSLAQIINQRQAVSSNIFWKKEFDLQKFGIGGLGEEFDLIFRKAVASRIFPPLVIKKLGIKYVKGMLFYGPSGTGKTLMARHIGKLLTGREPKIVNGPEVLGQFVGETEKNVRDLFADAEQEQKAKGDHSDLHVIIFDEIDVICKSRGSTRDGTGVQDSIVNQLFTKIDGVEALNNVLFIGITNKRYLLDKALLRPGRLEILVEFNLPDENGRHEILQIHMNKMKESDFLVTNVNLQELVARTKNYSGAELEGVVKGAVSFALNRQISMNDLTKELDDENIKVTMNDFLNSLQTIIPAFGASIDDLQQCRLKGMIDCGERHKQVYEITMLLVNQVKQNEYGELFTCLLEGPKGSGKTAMAATIALDSDFPFVKIVSPALSTRPNESIICEQIIQVFEDAYKSQLSIIILDDIEVLLNYCAVGHEFSKLISHTLRMRLKRPPPKGKNMLVIGTTSKVKFLESIGFCEEFSEIYHVPALAKADVIKVLENLNVFARDDIDAAAEALAGMTLKNVYAKIEKAATKEKEGNSESKKKINLNYLVDILSKKVSYI